MQEPSTKPYLIRAIHEWCGDNGYRPYIAVAVDERTVVPREFVRDGEIVLNVSVGATNRLRLGNDLIEFEARFGGVARQVSIPIANVSAIYAAETGHGMAFELSMIDEAAVAEDEPAGEPPSPPRGEPVLGVVPSEPRAPVLLRRPSTAGHEGAAPGEASEDAPRRGSGKAGDAAPGIASVDAGPSDTAPDTPPEVPPPPAPGGRPKLTRIK